MRIDAMIVLCLVVGFCSSDEDNYQMVMDIPEGSNCSWNGLDGVCANILNCRSAKDSIARKVQPPICSFQGATPIVCCTDCELIHSTTTPIADFTVGSRFNQTGSKARDNCIKYLENFDYPCSFPSRIQYEERSHPEKKCYGYVEPSALEDAYEDALIASGHYFDPEDPHGFGPVRPISAGIDARRNQYPHMALLGYGDDLKTAQWLCGGSIISERYILTAAHCISSPSVGPIKFTALGILKRSDPPELWQTHIVKRIIAHPQYQPPSKYNDIALLETEGTIKFDFRVLPACLHLMPESDEIAEASGWGALGHHQGLADTLQTVKLQRYDAEKCSQLYPIHRHLREGYNHTTQMCYGDTKIAKDTCEGDSGGPLQTVNEFLGCAYTVLGVTSYGRQCGISAGSGMYTRVYHYVPWIESVVWP